MDNESLCLGGSGQDGPRCQTSLAIADILKTAVVVVMIMRYDSEDQYRILACILEW